MPDCYCKSVIKQCGEKNCEQDFSGAVSRGKSHCQELGLIPHFRQYDK